jgi:hypothetical protein
MRNFRDFSKKGILEAFMLFALSSTINAADQKERIKEVDVYVEFHSSMEAEQVRIIVKNAGNREVVKTFDAPGVYKLASGTYTFAVSGNTKLYSKNDLKKNTTSLETIERIQSPCELVIHDGQIETMFDINSSNVMRPIVITVFGDDHPKRDRTKSDTFNQIRCQVVWPDLD